jgi:cytochrome c oxidase subunit 3
LYVFSIYKYIYLPSKKLHQEKLKMIRQPFHLVEIRPWPLTASIGAFTLTVGLTAWFHIHFIYPLALATMLIILSIIQWWRDVIRERTFIGHHTSYVTTGLRWGIILFITSEVLFFFAFFWAFFHRRLAPTPELGCCWPPTGIKPLNPFSVPLLNTAVLLASGVTVTWAHHSLVETNRINCIQALSLTITLGIYFTILQAGEYIEASFTIADRVYGSTFFVATGFHGAHVLIGSSFLTVCLIRAIKHQFSSTHHFGFEAAAWYWHFVDVVWICLYLCIYWWRS